MYIQHIFIDFILEILDNLRDLKKNNIHYIITELTNSHVIYNAGIHVSLLLFIHVKVINDLKYVLYIK